MDGSLNDLEFIRSESLLQLLHSNASLNYATISKTLSECDPPLTCGTCDVLEIEWGNVQHMDHLFGFQSHSSTNSLSPSISYTPPFPSLSLSPSQLSASSFLPLTNPPDVIIGSDILYDAPSFPSLISSLKTLSRAPSSLSCSPHSTTISPPHSHLSSSLHPSPSPLIILTHPLRKKRTNDLFFELSSKAGFKITHQKVNGNDTSLSPSASHSDYVGNDVIVTHLQYME